MNGTMSTKLGYRAGLPVWRVAVCLLAVSGFGLMGCQTGGGGGGGGNTNTNVNGNTNANANQNVNVNDNTPPPNQAPTANAGPDQSVTGGATVNLNGAGSSDPDGDTLTFTWTQTGGTGVTLNGAGTATPSFVSAAASDTLIFRLVVNDGTVDSAPDEVVVTVTAPTVPRLYISSANAGGNVVSYANPATVNGNIVPDTNLQGAQTQLTAPFDIVVNAANQLLVANGGATPRITVYDNADQANGNFAPDGNVSGAATTLLLPISLAYSVGEDLLFVANNGTNQILVFTETANTTFNGNRAPTRVISSAGNLNGPTGINFGASDDLYVANATAGNILVFANASSANGNITPTRVLTNAAALAGVVDVYVDPSDHLFAVISGAAARVLVFNNAASLNGPVSPDFTLTVPGAGHNLVAIAVDSNDVGYISDNGAAFNAVYSYDNISTRNGTLSPDRTISGANTQLVTPLRLFLTE
jgi:hypothetical protein